MFSFQSAREGKSKKKDLEEFFSTNPGSWKEKKKKLDLGTAVTTTSSAVCT